MSNQNNFNLRSIWSWLVDNLFLNFEPAFFGFIITGGLGILALFFRRNIIDTSLHLWRLFRDRKKLKEGRDDPESISVRAWISLEDKGGRFISALASPKMTVNNLVDGNIHLRNAIKNFASKQTEPRIVDLGEDQRALANLLRETGSLIYPHGALFKMANAKTREVRLLVALVVTPRSVETFDEPSLLKIFFTTSELLESMSGELGSQADLAHQKHGSMDRLDIFKILAKQWEEQEHHTVDGHVLITNTRVWLPEAYF